MNLHYSKLQKIKKILELNNKDTIITLIASAYNVNAIMHNRVCMRMITNPEAIFISDEEKEDFIKIVKELISNEIEFSRNEDLF